MKAPRWFQGRLASLGGAAALSILAAITLFGACTALMVEDRAQMIRRDDQLARNIVLLAAQSITDQVGRHDDDLRLLQNVLRRTGGTDPGTFADLLPDRLSENGFLLLGPTGSILRTVGDGADMALLRQIAPRVLAQTKGPFGLTVESHLASAQAPAVLTLTRLCQPESCGGASAIMAPLSLRPLYDHLSHLLLGQRDSLAILGADGRLLLRQPFVQRAVGQTILTPQILAEATETHALRMTVRSQIDHVVRRYTLTRAGDLPLIVTFGIGSTQGALGVGLLTAIFGAAVLVLSAMIVGLVLVMSRSGRRLAQAEQTARVAAVKLEELARTDPLTNVLNRRGFDEMMQREWRRACRTGSPIALLIIDADNFKRYNDTFGHQAGDEVLRFIATTITGTIRRPGDIAARQGGEEYAVILPETSYDGARVVAETVRAKIEEKAIPHPANGAGIVTISIGLGYAEPRPGDALDLLIARADASLYEAKALGRNRVVAHRAV